MGRGDPEGTRRAGLVGLGAGTAVMTTTALLFALFPRTLASLVAESPEVVEAAVPLLQIAAGGLVAGLDAGLAYNTWPLMDEKFIPGGLMEMSPAWVNFFENVITVQFQHRMLGYFVVLAVIDEARKSIRRGPEDAHAPAWTMILVVLVQVALGISTLLLHVPVTLDALHQAGAMALLTVLLGLAHEARFSAA